MIYVVLPAYNEEDAILTLLQKIDHEMKHQNLEYHVVVVNDGSKDQTGELIASIEGKFPVTVIRHKYNRGLGETIRDGFEYVAEVGSPEDILIRMDCDDTHEPKYMAGMIEKIDAGYEVVIASRYAPGGGEVGLDAYRHFLSLAANMLFKLSFPIRGVKEYTCGYRAYRVGLVQDALAIFGNRFIDLKGLGFTCTLEKLIKFQMMGAKATEVPFVLRYDQKLSVSKSVNKITILGCFILIFKYSWFWNFEGKLWRNALEDRKKRSAPS